MRAPIAIVGRSCLLPGASSPEALHGVLERGEVVIGHSPTGRFRLAAEHALTHDPTHSTDRAWSDLGGYVPAEFRFDPGGFELPAASLTGLDPLFHWVLHCGREALAGSKVARARTGAIFGNLSFPTSSMSARAEATWLAGTRFARPPVDPRNRFMSGLPAHLLAEALGLGGESFAIDAACASSLYAIALACEALESGRADAMLAGAVCRSDDLFIHVGFCALGAMSRTGASRPFHADADGLIPAEGAALFLLKRLEDAERDGDDILGVVRAVGLANDGRGRGLVAPSSEGQVRAMRAAYRDAGLSPADVAYVECHATGTPVGDATEVETLREVFGRGRALPIGSIKANMGHALTVAGSAGLLKVLHALRTGTFLPTPIEGPQSPALADGSFRVITAREPWVGPKRAGLSAFGFGGNDAHLLVEAHGLTRPVARRLAAARVGIVAMAARVGDGATTDSFRKSIVEGTPIGPRALRVEVPLEGLRTPPKDLSAALAQQTAFLAVASEVARQLPGLASPRTMVVVGMGCDPEVARYGGRWRAPELAPGMADRFIAPLGADGVLGTMPNIVTNRVNAQLDAGGPSFSVSAEELSGLRALQIAVRALARGDVDAALVGASDMSAEPVHSAALTEWTGLTGNPGDAAVALVLEREEDARKAGHPILAFLDAEDDAEVPLVLGNAPTARDLGPRVGEAHAASGLVALAAAVAALETGVLPRAEVRMTGLCSPGTTTRPSVVIRLTAGHGRALPVVPPARSLSLPAHPPPVSLPEGPPMEHMERAPRLVGILSSASAPAAAPSIPAITAISRGDALPSTALTAEVLERLRVHHAAVGESHRAHLTQQATLHAQFLELRGRALDTLLLASKGGLAPALSAALAEPSAPLLSAPVAAPAPVTRPSSTANGHAGQAVAARPAAPAPALAAAPAPAVGSARRAPVGPTFDRAALTVHAGGRISQIFGPLFEQQDIHTVQVRMPTEPLLLADRVTGLDSQPGVLGKGTIWTETDVKAGAIYLHAGRMTPGLMIESGQADLMLVSHQGIDFHNRGTRAYRLLGCNLTYHSSPPKVGDTLAYEIHADGHANQGDVRLFFFHYDCWVGDQRALSVREGQAGFFTKEELAASAGILWSAKTATPMPGARVDPPRVLCTRGALEPEQLRALVDDGDALTCFGPGFERAAPHTRTPAPPGGRMHFLDRVTGLDPAGGPWGRGYLRATQAIHPDDWFFDGHFKNDPCMPGTLMFDGCLATMALYLAALGFTLDKDGYRFEPIPDEEYKLRCRGQVTPTSKELVYEVFVEEVHDGDEPRLYADLLCTVDGLGAFHARRVGLRLVPDWPMSSMEELPPDPRALASVDGLTLDLRSLLACAWGMPSHAFGPRYRRFDSTRRVARLPGPPYHFLTRVVRVDGEPFALGPGAEVEVEYDVPEDAWYFAEGAAGAMPFSVLLEAALQPCGWLASFVGSTLGGDQDLMFRNLDGKGVIHAEVLPDAGVLRTVAKIVNVSPAAGMIIESFEVECFVGAKKVFTVSTVFGFFPKEALDNQVGLPTTPVQRALFSQESPYFVDLRPEPARYLGGSARLSAPMLRMIDRVTAFDPQGGAHGRGFIRSDMDVHPRAWFFKAHFFQDPVQPGSLGIEAMRQTLAFAMLELGLDAGIERARFLPLESGGTTPLIWKYRGQVIPKNQNVTVTMELTDHGRDARGSFARANASLWVDGKRIYEATDMTLRITSGDAEETLDLRKDRWLEDHCPTFVVPALPMMSMVDRLVGAALAYEGRSFVPLTLRDVRLSRWVTVEGSARLRTEVTRRDDGDLDVSLLVHRQARDARLSRFELAASGVVSFRVTPPLTVAALTGALPASDPYATGELFHGPAFQLLGPRVMAEGGADAVLHADRGSVPFGTLHQGLLDAATHALPHDELSRVAPEIETGRVGYPYRIPTMIVHAMPPRAGDVRCQARFSGFDGDPRFPTFDLALSVGDQRLVDLRLVEILMPKGRLGAASPGDRRAFLAQRRFVPGVSLSIPEGEATRLDDGAVAESDWLPGTLSRLFGLEGVADRTVAIAMKEHVARVAEVHPSQVSLGSSPQVPASPLARFSLAATREGGTVTVRDAASSRLDLAPVKAFWAQRFGLRGWPVEDLVFGLIERFVAAVRLADPGGFAALSGKSVVYLGNHQTGIESILFSVLASALSRSTTMTLAKAEHQESWIGQQLRLWFAYPGAHDPGVIAHFDRKEAASLLNILSDLGAAMKAEGKSLLVHVEGTRARSCRAKVAAMSGALLDLALATGSPVVPVRFSGGLPIEPVEDRLEFPIGMGRQTYHIGAPIPASELAALHYKERTERVLAAINGLGPSAEREVPHAPDPAFAAKVAAHAAATGVSQAHATLHEILREAKDPCPLTARILARDPVTGVDAAFAAALSRILFG